MIIQPDPVRDRKVQQSREREALKIESFSNLNGGVVLLLTLSCAISAFMAALSLLGPHREANQGFVIGCTMFCLITGPLAWFQSQFYLSAITITGLASSAITALTIYLRMTIPPPPKTAPALWGFALFFGFVMMWLALVALPLRVALQAWTWHLQGIELRNLQEEMRRRRVVPPGA